MLLNYATYLLSSVSAHSHGYVFVDKLHIVNEWINEFYFIQRGMGCTEVNENLSGYSQKQKRNKNKQQQKKYRMIHKQYKCTIAHSK